MKYLIISDTHLDENRRLNDYCKNLEVVENFSRKEKIDGYLHLGDVFQNTHYPTPLELKIFAEHWHSVSAKAKQICLGNHDIISNNLSTIEWLPQLKQKVLKLTDEKKKLYFAHRTVTEAEIGAYKKHLNAISYKDIYKETKADIIGLGHIHKAQIIHPKGKLVEVRDIGKDYPLVFIPGSIERVSFAERNEKKYFCVLEVEKNKTTLKYIRLDSRPMLYIIFDLNKKSLTVNDKKVKAFNPKDAIIKVDVLGKKELIDSINYDSFLEKFKGAYSLDDNFIYTDTAGVEQKATTLKTDKEYLTEYCQKRNIGKEVFNFCSKVIK